MAELEPFSISEWIVQLPGIHNKVVVSLLQQKHLPRRNSGIFQPRRVSLGLVLIHHILESGCRQSAVTAMRK
ncbi:hypothetical protein [Acidocella aromatica]|uniref:hypothetical protein n=1 Tax=Acidocella aromatica TaxID=1303579 RepID=UPI001605B2FB|nr:hypothetical protein [Acidocella aromatica]